MKRRQIHKKAFTPADKPAVSVDEDGIITAHSKADVWPYDDVATAVQVDTHYGYLLVIVERHDR